MTTSKDLERMQIILLYSGVPLPAMLDLGYRAAKNGASTALIYIDRCGKDLPIDNNLIVYPVKRLAFRFSGIGVKRFVLFPKMLLMVWRELHSLAKAESVVITAGLDSLVIASLYSLIFKPIVVRHQVRDLHKWQLSNSFITSILKTVEKFALKRCDIIAASSPKFISAYYSKIYDGKTIVLENLPKREVWGAYKSRVEQPIVVGYIGIVRYKKQLKNLVDAVISINKKGFNVKLLITGGGASEFICEFEIDHPIIEYADQYKYTEEIARIYSGINIIYAVYDRNDFNCQIALPTKMYEAMITKVPIIVASGTYVAEVVTKIGIGIAVDGESVDAIADCLKDINQPNSWYSKAKRELAKINLEKLYENYDAAIMQMVE